MQSAGPRYARGLFARPGRQSARGTPATRSGGLSADPAPGEPLSGRPPYGLAGTGPAVPGTAVCAVQSSLAAGDRRRQRLFAAPVDHHLARRKNLLRICEDWKTRIWEDLNQFEFMQPPGPLPASLLRTIRAMKPQKSRERKLMQGTEPASASKISFYMRWN